MGPDRNVFFVEDQDGQLSEQIKTLDELGRIIAAHKCETIVFARVELGGAVVDEQHFQATTVMPAEFSKRK